MNDERHWIGKVWDHIKSTGSAYAVIQQISERSCAYNRVKPFAPILPAANDDSFQGR